MSFIKNDFHKDSSVDKNFKHQRMHKEFFSSIITHTYIFRPCWVIFREKPSVIVTLGCTIQLSENVLLTVNSSVGIS
jgi:hypothetical protein